MKRNKHSAIEVGVLVALAGSIKKTITTAAVGTSLAILLSLGGCTQSHLDCTKLPEVCAATDDDGDGFTADNDCNDFDEDVFPGAPEIQCDGVDQDCNGRDSCDNPCGDDGFTCNPVPDWDGDGFAEWEDCDDNDASIYPGAPEPICDGVDNNCMPDEDQEQCGPVEPTCEPLPRCDVCEPECMDLLESLGCDTIAIACNPAPDIDLDMDGYSSFEDCNDEDASINPGVEEGVCPDGVDQDCDGTDGEIGLCNAAPDVDLDQDGFPASVDCDDNNYLIHPNAVEPDCTDGVDQNCDGQDGMARCLPIDADGDGVSFYTDCDDNNPNIYPGAVEDCCGLDLNCDSQVDPVDGSVCPDVICPQ